MVKYDKSVLVMVGGDHLFHGTNHRINLLVDYLKRCFRQVVIVSPNQDVQPTQQLVDKINSGSLTFKDLIYKESEDNNVKYYMIPPFLGYKDMPVVMKSYVPLLLKDQHFDICYSHGVELSNLPKTLKESKIVDHTIYMDVDYTPGFEYGDEFKKAVMALEEISIESNDIVISVSQELAELRKKKFPQKEIFGSPNGVRYDLFAKAQSEPRKQPIMIYTGWLGPTYGVQFPIYALPQIVKEIPDAKYVIVGFGDDAYKRTLAHIVEDLGVEKNVIFYDKQPYDQLPGFLKSARIGIATFKNSEINQIVCPLKVFEYFAAGLPVLGADFGGLGRIMGESNAGIKTSSIEEIAQAAINIFKDDVLFDKYQNNAIQYAKNFDIDHLLGKELETVNSYFYNQIPIKSVKNEKNSVCNICGSQDGFDLNNPEGPRESWNCKKCASTSRDRMYIYALAKALGKTEPMLNWQQDKSIKVLESAGARAHPNILSQKYDYINTIFDPEIMEEPGYDFNKYVDLQSLRFANESYDVIMNSDVFEHIRLHTQALQEIFRVLKPGGVLVLTVPMSPGRDKTIVRIRPEGEEDVYLLPAHYHAEHTLVYRDYGDDFIDEIESYGFEVEMIDAEIPEHCITPQKVFIVRKPVTAISDVLNKINLDMKKDWNDREKENEEINKKNLDHLSQQSSEYKTKIQNEIAIYEHVTDVHKLPEVHGFYGTEFLNQHISDLMGSTGYQTWWIDEIKQLVKKLNRPAKILSLACGNGDTEIDLLKKIDMNDKVSITGIDINPVMIERAQDLARENKKDNAFFEVHDLNFLKLNKAYDVIIANHSLHHIVNLEEMFEEISKTASNEMIFLINDMIGRNGHVMWDNAAQIVRTIWNIIDKKYKLNAFSKQYDIQPYNSDCSISGFEGIRAEDILPNLVKYFDMELFFPFSVLLNRFVDRTYGHNFNVKNQNDIDLIKQIIELDAKLLQEGKLSPTQAFIKVQKKGTVKKPRWIFQEPTNAIKARDNRLNESDYISEIKNIAKLMGKNFDKSFISKMDESKVSIVVPVFNNVGLTHKCLKAVLENTKYSNYEIIIVDNASTDGTIDYLKNINDSRIKTFFNSQNEGFVKACNLGVKNAAGDYVLLLNNDTEVQENWLTSLVNLAEDRDDCGAVGSKLVYPDGKLQEAGGIIFSDGDGWNFGRGLDPNDPRFNYVREVDYCSGAALMIKKEIWNELGGFDNQYSPAYYEDTDLCFGIRKLGYKVFYQPESVVVHYEGQTAGTNIEEGFKKYQQLNRVKFVKKWKKELSGQQTHHTQNVLSASSRNIKGSIFVADPFLPIYDRASGSLRLFSYLKILKELGFHVTYLARSESNEIRYKMELQQMGIEVYASDEEALKAAGYNLQFSGKKINYDLLFTERKFDYAILSFWDIAEYYLPIIRKYAPSTKIIVDTVDIHFIREMREAELVKDNKLKKEVETRKKREVSVYKKADSLWVVTETDRKSVKTFVKNKPIEVVPNIHKKIDSIKTFKNSSDLLFVGNFSHTPNVDAVLHFYKNIWPTVTKKLPDVKLNIVGNNPPQTIKSLASDKITVTGFVPKIDPYLESARISINPLRYGAGMKGKIGEALSWGLPVVTTSIGAEGMHLKNERHAIVADEAKDFTEKIISLYNDEKLWKKLSKEGKNLVKKNWSPGTIFNNLQNIFESETIEADKESPLVSIVILTFNALDYTKKCVQSIQKYTKTPHEIIFVDNGSTDQTKKYLKELVKKNNNYKMIANSKNMGFAAGNNQGVKKATGEYVLLLNNDVEVSEGWLESMTRTLILDDKIGMVGPITNSISGLQQVKEVPYKDDKGYHQYAKKVREVNEGVITPRRRIAGFAVLMVKKVYNEVGGFDTSFGTGNYEDDDLCLRVREKGYAILVDESTFIHHYGSQTFNENNIDYLESLEERKKIFTKKWPNVDYEELLEIKNPLFEQHDSKIKEAYELLTNGNAIEALEVFKSILTENPISGEGLLGVSYSFRQLKKFNEAVAHLKKLTELQPDNAIAFNQLGLISLESGDLENAEFMFTQAIEKDNSFVDAQRNYADVLIEKGDFESGIVAFNKILVNHPNDIESLLYLAQLNLEAARFDECQTFINNVFEVEPENAAAKEIQRLINESYVKEKDFEEEISQGQKYLEEGNLGKADQVFEKILDKSPEHVTALYGSGLILQLQGKNDLAKDTYEKVKNLAPQFEDVYNNLGIILMQEGNTEDALEYFRNVLQINPDNINAQINISDALVEMQKFEEGIQTLMLTLESHPKEINALLRMGNLYREAGKENEAEDYFHKVLEIEPGNEIAREALA